MRVDDFLLDIKDLSQESRHARINEFGLLHGIESSDILLSMYDEYIDGNIFNNYDNKDQDLIIPSIRRLYEYLYNSEDRSYRWTSSKNYIFQSSFDVNDFVILLMIKWNKIAPSMRRTFKQDQWEGMLLDLIVRDFTNPTLEKISHMSDKEISQKIRDIKIKQVFSI